MVVSWVQDSSALKGVWVEKLSPNDLVIHVYPDATAAEVIRVASPILDQYGISVGWAFGDRLPFTPGDNVERN